MTLVLCTMNTIIFKNQANSCPHIHKTTNLCIQNKVALVQRLKKK